MREAFVCRSGVLAANPEAKAAPILYSDPDLAHDCRESAGVPEFHNALRSGIKREDGAHLPQVAIPSLPPQR